MFLKGFNFFVFASVMTCDSDAVYLCKKFGFFATLGGFVCVNNLKCVFSFWVSSLFVFEEFRGQWNHFNATSLLDHFMVVLFTASWQVCRSVSTENLHQSRSTAKTCWRVVQSAGGRMYSRINNLLRSDLINPLGQNTGIIQSADQTWRGRTPVSSSCGTWSRFQMDDSLFAAVCSACLYICMIPRCPSLSLNTHTHTHTYVFPQSPSLSVWPSLCLAIDLGHSKWLIPFK